MYFPSQQHTDMQVRMSLIILTLNSVNTVVVRHRVDTLIIYTLKHKVTVDTGHILLYCLRLKSLLMPWVIQWSHWSHILNLHILWLGTAYNGQNGYLVTYCTLTYICDCVQWSHWSHFHILYIDIIMGLGTIVTLVAKCQWITMILMDI